MNKNVIIRWEQGPENYLLNPENQKYSYYIRVKSADISKFSDLETVTLDKDGYENEFAIITPLLDEKDINKFLNSERLSGATILGKIRLI